MGWATVVASRGKLNIAVVLIVAGLGAEASSLAGYGIGDQCVLPSESHDSESGHAIYAGDLTRSPSPRSPRHEHSNMKITDRKREGRPRTTVRRVLALGRMVVQARENECSVMVACQLRWRAQDRWPFRRFG
jgi:hypothetical protein